MSDDRGQAPATSMLDRIELVLEALDDNGYLTLSETARLTGIPSSSAHRLLERMVSMRWLHRDGSRYELGVRLFELGSRAVRNHWFHRTALPILQDLHRSTGMVVHLAVLDGADTIYWEKLSGSFGANVPSRLGGRYPAHRSAVGKALLMRLPREHLDQPTFAHLEAGVVGGRKALEAELDLALAEGITYDRGTSVPDLGCLGASISRGIPKPAAISICGPLDRIVNDRRMAEAVQRAAAAIERAARRADAAARTT
ncbi:IclR family transcriptional regulator [Prescottella defluvii]|uniref:IclR family transcriptional regulator n=1 Tax=Prescottella defluvii TaxID=1323361 RepID=UPI0004F32410|nr:IclR family transcriptional regulator [Prescottella defluvii]